VWGVRVEKISLSRKFNMKRPFNEWIKHGWRYKGSKWRWVFALSSLVIIGLLYLDSIDVIVLSNLNVFFTITMFSGAFALCMSNIETGYGDYGGGD